MSAYTARKGLLERLKEGIVIGDGGFCHALEKRGYVKAGVWTPQCTVLHPEAVRQLHREFLRAGAHVMQAFNFHANESKLTNTAERTKVKLPEGKDINLAAYNIAREVADEGGALVSISLSQPVSYLKGASKDTVQDELRNQLQIFKESNCDIDFVALEFHESIEEMEWAIEVCKEYSYPIAATMSIATHDLNGVSAGKCAVRMAKAGADVVGINCKFGPPTCLQTMKLMKEALDENNLSPYLMVQPVGCFTPEVESKEGLLSLPGHFFAYEPRVCTRFEMQHYAREAYELGVRYIGGCCGTEPYHIRAIAEILSDITNIVPPVTREFGDILSGIQDHPRPLIKASADPSYWKTFKPSTGRPESSAFATFD